MVDDEKIRIALKMIETAVDIDESMVRLLNFELSGIRKLYKENRLERGVLERFNGVVRNVVMALMLSDGRIKAGMDLLDPRARSDG